MAEFFEVPVRREDGSVGLHYVNIEAVSYVDLETEAGKVVSDGVKVHINNGYWFTLSGPKAEEVLSLIKNRACLHFKERVAGNEPDRP